MKMNNSAMVDETAIEKPRRPTTLQDIHGNLPVSNTAEKTKKTLFRNIENRRQSLPVNSTTLQVPHSASVGATAITPYDAETSSCPGSPQRRYISMTPLMTPALSVSSLVSSLDGSMENLNLEDKEENEDEDKTKNPPKWATNKILSNFEAAHEKDIVNNRLKYFFKTLDNEEYFETHIGKELPPIANIFTNSPITESKKFQER